MEKYKPGLHKKISSIFDGAPVAMNNNSAQPFGDSVKNNVAQDSAKPPAPAPTPKVSPTVNRQQSPQPKPATNEVKTTQIDQSEKSNSAKFLWLRIQTQVGEKLFAPKPGVDVARQKKIAVLVPVLFVIFVFVMVRTFSVPSKGAKAEQKVFGPSNAIASSTTAKAKWHAPDVYPEALRDPMRIGSIGTSGATEGLVVKGIVFSEDRPSAVVAGEIVYEGDRIFEAIVVKITKNSVEFEVDGKRFKRKVRR
ncbi:MAG: hypothetical protein KAS75_05975 [Planctomycetes bacterium]|nr:hypothetical protein [Planctomycetota bacterium]